MGSIKSAIAMSVAILVVGHACAEVTDSEAKALGTTLTAFGADPKASADGLVSAYTGEPIKPPASYKEGSGRYPDPFSGEKPVVSITQKNMAEYSDKLTEGTKELLKRYPDFRVDVFPSHRTMVYPQWVLEKTKELARTASLSSDNLNVENAWGGIPFPIPKRGAEVIWNFTLAYTHFSHDGLNSAFLVDSSGNATEVGRNRVMAYSAYYDPAAKPDKWYRKWTTTFVGPPSSVGQKILEWLPLNYQHDDETIYAYTPGLRRVRLAPELTYDTPVSFIGGAELGDEVNLWDGKMDRFDWKIVGKREMIIPYNTYRFHFETPLSQMLGKHFISPDALRWEVHRVWVVQADLKPSARHVVLRRTYYVDEDSWAIVATDAYDHSGNIYRAGFGPHFVPYGSVPNQPFLNQFIYDFSKGNYSMAGIETPSGFYKVLPDVPFKSGLTPDALAGAGVR